MFARFISMILFTAAAVALAACQQQSKPAEPAPQAQTEAPAPAAQPAGPAMTAKPAAPAPAPTPKPAATAPAPKASTAMTPKPAAPALAPKPVVAAPAPAPKPAATAPKPEAMATTANPFNTKKCSVCHAIDHDKVGPAWKTVVEKYGDEATLAKDFESGFKERRVANSIAKWKPKEGLMTPQFNNLIKGHEKEAAHALFESVKNGKFGSY